jgi:hypothetical protein
MKLVAAAALTAALALPASAQSLDPALEMHALTHEMGLQYDGYFWHYYQHNWYVAQASSGPWTWVEPVYVPVYVQQVPVRYSRRPLAPPPDPQLVRRMQSNPRMPTDAAVRDYFWGAPGGARAVTGIERPARR